MIDRLDSHGRRFDGGSGFFIGENTVATAFQVIDGAEALRVVLPSGQRVESQMILAWNRHQDWALVVVEATSMPRLMRGDSARAAVGDHVYVLDATGGGRTLAEADLVGIQNHAAAGKRLALSYAPSEAAVGGPVLDEFGKVIGIIGGSLLPGASTLQSLRFGTTTGIFKVTGVLNGALSVPIDLVSLHDGHKATLAEMSSSGQFIRLLTQSEQVMSGLMCKQVEHRTPYGRPINESIEFRATDSEIYVYVTWDSKEKRKGETAMEMYDVENHKLLQSPSSKLNLEQGRLLSVDWKLPVGNLRPGMYRVDVLLDGEPAWRSFFRILE
jgi:hypothetical protein